MIRIIATGTINDDFLEKLTSDLNQVGKDEEIEVLRSNLKESQRVSTVG